MTHESLDHDKCLLRLGVENRGFNLSYSGEKMINSISEKIQEKVYI